MTPGFPSFRMVLAGMLLAVFPLAPSAAVFQATVNPNLNLVTTPSQQNANDLLAWSQLGPAPAALQSDFSAKTAGGHAVAVNLNGPGSLTALVCPMTACSWSGSNLAAGDVLMWTSDGAGGGNGPLTMQFDPASGVGAFIQADSPGQFTALIQAFHNGTLLGSFTETSANGDAVYLGVVDQSGANITSVRIGLVSCSGLCATSDFAIDQISFKFPSLSYSISALGGLSRATSNTAPAPQVGYAVIQPTTGSATPSGIAIFGYRANNTLVSETGVPASLPLTSGRIYAEIASAVDTGLAIANPNASAAKITFSFTDGAGNTIGTGTTTIAANAQVSAFLDGSPFNGPSQFQGTFSFQSSLPLGVIALRLLTNERNEPLMSTLPVIDTTAAPASGSQVIPHFADGAGWSTQILLVNASNATITGKLQFSNPDGSAAAVTIGGSTGTNFSYAVAPGSSQKLVTSGGGTSITTGTVGVNPVAGAAPTPLVIFSFRTGGVTVSEAGVPVTNGTAMRMYVESSGQTGQPGNIQSGVAIGNPSSSAADVIFEITGLDGATASNPVKVNLPGSGQTTALLANLFPALPNPFEGILRITTTSSGVSVVGLRIHYNERNESLITTTSNTTVFPQIVDGGGFTTQFILFNRNTGQSAAGTQLGSVSTFQPTGKPLFLTLQ